MELRQLEYLVTVVEEASFTRAAERLHVAQPGISARLRRLERELGHTLLDRSGREVRATEAGLAVLPHARAALQAAAGVRVSLDDLDGLLRGRVAVGTVPAGGGPLDLADLLAGFHRDHPGVEITLSEDASPRLVEGLLERRLDLALLGLPKTTPEGLAVQVVADQRLAAIVGEDHPRARRRTVRLAELAEEPLLTLPAGSGVRSALEAGFAAAGLRPRIGFEAGDPAVLLRLARQGLGIAVLPVGEDPGGLTDGLREIAITHPSMRARLVLAWKAGAPAGPATVALIEAATGSAGPSH